MAQPSKKDQIADAALLLFLEHGIKGTSVDMMVKTSGVPKPTIYNHFPDKATLLIHVVQCWMNTQPAPAFTSKSLATVRKEITRQWLTSDNLRLYGLFIGEGFRAPEARDLFKRHFDQPWRQALFAWGDKNEQDALSLNALVNDTIVQALL